MESQRCGERDRERVWKLLSAFDSARLHQSRSNRGLNCPFRHWSYIGRDSKDGAFRVDDSRSASRRDAVALTPPGAVRCPVLFRTRPFEAKLSQGGCGRAVGGNGQGMPAGSWLLRGCSRLATRKMKGAGVQRSFNRHVEVAKRCCFLLLPLRTWNPGSTVSVVVVL